MSEFFDYEEDCGYALDDPKHPTFYERYADHADWQRKAEKERQLVEILDEEKDVPRA